MEVLRSTDRSGELEPHHPWSGIADEPARVAAKGHVKKVAPPQISEEDGATFGGADVPPAGRQADSLEPEEEVLIPLFDLRIGDHIRSGEIDLGDIVTGGIVMTQDEFAPLLMPQFEEYVVHFEEQPASVPIALIDLIRGRVFGVEAKLEHALPALAEIEFTFEFEPARILIVIDEAAPARAVVPHEHGPI